MTLEFVLHILFPTRSQQFFCFDWDVTWTRLSPVTVKVSSRLNETSWDVQLLFSSSNRRTEEGLFRFDSLVDKTNVIKSKFVSFFYHLYSANKIRNWRSFFIRRIKVVRRVSSSCCCWVCLFLSSSVSTFFCLSLHLRTAPGGQRALLECLYQMIINTIDW